MSAMTRREQQQLALRRDVLDAALAQLDEGGPTAVNWRALATRRRRQPVDAVHLLRQPRRAVHRPDRRDLRRDGVRPSAVRSTPRADPPTGYAQRRAGYRRFARRHPARVQPGVHRRPCPGTWLPTAARRSAAQLAVMAPLRRCRAPDARVDRRCRTSSTWPVAMPAHAVACVLDATATVPSASRSTITSTGIRISTRSSNRSSRVPSSASTACSTVSSARSAELHQGSDP